MGNIMKQARRLQEELAKAQAEIAEMKVEATAGGGMVTATVTGNQEIVSLKIAPEAVDPDDVEMLEDLVRAAVNEAIKKSREMMSEEMAKITGGLPLPGIF
ncbi:YbaB/EbfC family nucleoid-associated protein [bacterium]|nr:YbaB/EbfC family nucleoid-associated protein [bacterium]